MNRMLKRRLEDLLLLGETNLPIDVRRVIMEYDRIASASTEADEEDLLLAKEAILEKWPTLESQLTVLFDKQGHDRPAVAAAFREVGVAAIEERRRPDQSSVRQRRMLRITPEERAAKIAERKTGLRDKVREKKKPKA
jgi:hypothetical protein